MKTQITGLRLDKFGKYAFWGTINGFSFECPTIHTLEEISKGFGVPIKDLKKLIR